MAPERGEGSLAEENITASPALDIAILPLVGSQHSMINIKEEEVDRIGRNEDDDLTSLTWLQDKNLLKGINLRRQVGKQESPPSDYIEESASESTCSSVASSPAGMQTVSHNNNNNISASNNNNISTTNNGSATGNTVGSNTINSISSSVNNNSGSQGAAVLHAKNKHPHHIPYDPKVHITSKPPYSFSCLIFMSIENSAGKALPVKEIYAWILEHFPYYRTAPTGWKNSVRHNLSLNKCFRKVDKAPNLGKGSLWMVDPVFRPNLVQALMKAPYHPYTNLEKITASKDSMHIRASPVRERRDSDTNGYTSLDEIDDVDAARAMLALKHGPNHMEYLINNSDNCHVDYSPGGIKHKVLYDENGMVMMRRSDEDHTYSVDTTGTDSADEAFNSDSNSSWCNSKLSESELEEQRKTAEGADALLNLAGIRTTGRTESPDRIVRPNSNLWQSKFSPEIQTTTTWMCKASTSPERRTAAIPSWTPRARSPERHQTMWIRKSAEERQNSTTWPRKRAADSIQSSATSKHRRLLTLNNNTIKVRRKPHSPLFKSKR